MTKISEIVNPESSQIRSETEGPESWPQTPEPKAVYIWPVGAHRSGNIVRIRVLSAHFVDKECPRMGKVEKSIFTRALWGKEFGTSW